MTDYNNPNYFIASDGALWFGPTNPEENLHYSKFAGSLDPEGNPIWVLSRTDPPADAVRATHPHAQGRAEAAAVVVNEVIKHAVRWHKAMSLPNISLETNLEVDFELHDAVTKYLAAVDAAKEREP